MAMVTAWRTDDPCRVCGTGLILLDDGASPWVMECRPCGHADIWTSDQAAGGDR